MWKGLSYMQERVQAKQSYLARTPALGLPCMFMDCQPLLVFRPKQWIATLPCNTSACDGLLMLCMVPNRLPRTSCDITACAGLLMLCMVPQWLRERKHNCKSITRLQTDNCADLAIVVVYMLKRCAGSRPV